MVGLRINDTLQTGAVRKPHLPFSRLVGTVSNSADAVRLETAPTGGRKCLFILAHVKRKCKPRIEIVGAGSPRPQSVRVGGPNPYEDSVAVARFLNMNLYF